MEADCLAWSLVQLSRNRVELMLRQPWQVYSLGHVLTEQAIRVLVTSPLPWALRAAEVNLDGRGQGELLVSMHLGALAAVQSGSLRAFLMNALTTVCVSLPSGFTNSAYRV